MPRRTNDRVDVIEFNGIKFRRYPDSKNWSDQSYYRPNSTHIVSGVGNLHQEIWKSVNGEIPEGHEIHHVDGNPLNNDIPNLQCVSIHDHKGFHLVKSDSWKEKNKQSVIKAVEAARQWSHTDIGRAFRKKLAPIIGKLAWENAEYKSYTCVVCGSEFKSRTMQNDYAKFCSNNCKSKYRRDSHVDDIEFVCQWCGKTFMADKYAKSKTCSRKCGARYRSAKARNRL